jgi:hypothetical protein
MDRTGARTLDQRRLEMINSRIVSVALVAELGTKGLSPGSKLSWWPLTCSTRREGTRVCPDPRAAPATPRIARRRSLRCFLALRFLELGRHVLRQPIDAERAKKGIAAPMRKATEDTVDLHFALSKSIWTKLHTEAYIARIPPCCTYLSPY